MNKKSMLCLKSFNFAKAIGVLVLLILASGEVIAGKAEADNSVNQKNRGRNFFAVVNNEKVEVSDFLYAFSKAVKEKFYHGKVSQEQLNTFKKEVAEKLVMEILLSKEAQKRGLRPNADKVQQELNKYDAKQSNESPEKEKEWVRFRKEALPIIKASIERGQLIQLLEQDVKKIAPPPIEDIKTYYKANEKKFTAPQQWDVSMILLPVDPSASSDEWDQTVEKAEQLLRKINKGESFEELARIHSGDESAANGGHMGYMHIGMFGAPAQKVLNVMDVGEISEPVVLLEGVAIFRLNGVEKATLNPFGEVEERARKLLMRDLEENAWETFKSAIRKDAKVEYGEIFASESN